MKKTIEQRIQEKIEKFSGLLSREAAIWIINKEDELEQKRGVSIEA